MTKIPYTLSLLLPTLSPAAEITIYDDSRVRKILFSGRVVKAAKEGELLDREVKHIGFNETALKTIDVFVY